MQKFNEIQQEFAHREVPLPDFWGGYRVIPNEFEFWQQGDHRLHDRFEYRQIEDGNWRIQRLSP